MLPAVGNLAGETRKSNAPSGKPDGQARRYEDIAAAITQAIKSGKYGVGAYLPTEAQLCEQWGVSRSTVRQALGVLKQAGLIEPRQGSGTRVIATHEPLRYVLSVTSEEDILRYAAEAVFEPITGAKPATSPDARRLQLGDPTQWSVITGLRRDRARGALIALTSLYIPNRYSQTIDKVRDPIHGAIFADVLGDHGLTLASIEQAISATVLTKEEAKLLRSEVGSPALVVVKRFFSDEAGLIEVSESVHPADRFSYSIRLDKETPRGATTDLPRGL